MTDFFYDWNRVENPWILNRPFALVDETLRDGIQSPSVRNPAIGDKLEILHLMEACGIDCANVGLPGAGAEAVRDVTRLVEEIRDCKLKIQPNCAARTHQNDIGAVIDIAQKTGCSIEVCAFIGASPIRRLVEGWDLDKIQNLVIDSIRLVVENGLPATFVTEDTIRSDPSTLDRLFRAAIDHGATRLVLTDTVGHATPTGLTNLLNFTRSVLRAAGAEHVQLDWHGHNDRGLSLALCLAALQQGVNRVHGTCLGVGERVGNAPIDQILVNLRLLDSLDTDLSRLAEYVEKVSQSYEVPIPFSYPVFGSDAFRTSTGVHAAAIIKAIRSGQKGLADLVYSSVPARDVGRRQVIEVGYYSGKSNIVFWLEERKVEVTPARVDAIWDLAKSGNRTLSDEDIFGCLAQHDLLESTGR